MAEGAATDKFRLALDTAPVDLRFPFLFFESGEFLKLFCKIGCTRIPDGGASLAVPGPIGHFRFCEGVCNGESWWQGITGPELWTFPSVLDVEDHRLLSEGSSARLAIRCRFLACSRGHALVSHVGSDWNVAMGPDKR